MIIHSIKLKDFISHKETFMDLPLGLTAIIGDNGAGKTSILDAISYALFKEHSRGKDENLINRRASSALVQLVFSSGGRRYEITWRLVRRKRALATLRDLTSGSTIFVDSGERTVLPELEKILGLSREIFLNAAYVKQGEMARLLEARPAERKEIISKLLGIESLEKIWEGLRAPIRVLEERLEGLRKEVEKKADLEEELQETEAELAEAREKLRLIEEKLKDLEARYNEAEDRFGRMEENRRRLEGLREAISKLENLLSTRRKELENFRRDLELVKEAEKELSSLEEAEKERRTLESEVERLRNRISEAKLMEAKKGILERRIEEVSSELSSLRSLMTGYMKKIKELSEIEEVREEELTSALRSILSNYRKKKEELRQKLQEILEAIGEVQGRRSIAMNHLEELESGGSICPLCKRPMSGEHKERVLEEIHREIEDYERKVKVLEVERDEIEIELERISSVVNELSRIDLETLEEHLLKVKSLEEEREKLKEELREIRELERLDVLEEELSLRLKKLKEVEGKIMKLEREKGVLEKLGSGEVVEKKISRLSSEITELESKKGWMLERMRKIEYSEREYEKLKDELKRLSNSIGKLREEHSALDQKIKDLEASENKIRIELEKVERAERRLKLLESYLRSLKTVREIFGKNGVQRYARAVARRSIEYYSRRFLQFFNLAYSDLKLDEDYNVYVYGPFGEQSIDSLSGGEKTAIALCLRLGIAAALTGDKIRCLLMDEPTTHLDLERRRELIRLLRSFRGERGLIPQTIIVTHDPEIEQAANQIYHISLMDGYSHVERI